MKSKGGSSTLSKSITICSLGPLDRMIIEHVAGAISSRCGLRYKISSRMDSLKYAFDEKRGQYNSKLILKRLTELPLNSLKFLAITEVDLFVPILKYVFGLAQVGGQCAIISTYRLRPPFYDHEPNQDLLMDRIGKTALHELGHSLGLLTHCRDRHCVMHSSTSIGDTDFKRSDFCPTCFELFRWQLENCGIRIKPRMPQS